MHTIRRQFQFFAGHKLENPIPFGCPNRIHWHTYIIECFFKTKFYDYTEMTRVCNKFECFKQSVCKELDRAILLHKKYKKHLLDLENGCMIKKPVFLKQEPTVGHLAKYLYDWLLVDIGGNLPHDATFLDAVRIHETPYPVKCPVKWVEYRDRE